MCEDVNKGEGEGKVSLASAAIRSPTAASTLFFFYLILPYGPFLLFLLSPPQHTSFTTQIPRKLQTYNMSSGTNTSAGQNDSVHHSPIPSRPRMSQPNNSQDPSMASSSLQLEFDYNASWNFSYTYPISLPQILPRIDPDEDGTVVQKIAWKIKEILEPICAMQHASYDEAMELGRQIQMGLDHNGAMVCLKPSPCSRKT